MSSPLEHLSSTIGRRDEAPNITLAESIVRHHDSKAVDILCDAFGNETKAIQSDCIKVLYEVGARNPNLIAHRFKDFLALLDHKENRIVWGAMTALDMLTEIIPREIFRALPRILDAAQKGSVITRDHAVAILVKLSGLKQYREDTLPLLLEQLARAPENQLPMYAESLLPIADRDSKDALNKVLLSRMSEMTRESRQKRLEKVIRSLGKL